jgi:3-hydroxyacyl-CoA dehydrogenase
MIRRIEKAAVIGSGIMGGGIAALCASAGIRTLLLDIVPFDLKDEEKNNPSARNRIVEAGIQAQLKAKPAAFMDKAHDVAMIEKGNLTDDFSKLAECDIIFEVVVENLKIKQELFERIEKVRKPGSIIASNTSGLPIAKMAEGRSKDFREHFLITHFFNPVRYMKILEMVAGPDTKKEVCDFTAKWGEQILGKGIVWGKDTPNFIGNRIGVELMCEAISLIDKGIGTIPEADAIFSKPMGIPGTAVFGLADFVGNDTIDHIAVNSYELLTKDEYREIYNLPAFYKKMIENKMFGNKTRDKGGFYLSTKGPDGKKIKKVIDPKTGQHVDFDSKAKYPVVEAVKAMGTIQEKIKYIFMNHDFAKKLLSSMCVYSANRIPEITDSIVDLDNAMKWGYAWQMGPFEMWDSIGIADSLPEIEKAGFAVPANVKKMAGKGASSFYRINNGRKQYWDFTSESYKDIVYSPQMIFLEDLKADKAKVVKGNKSASLVDLGDGVLCFEFHSKMNAINGEIISLINEVSDYIKNNGVGLVIGNQAAGIPPAFSAGGDLKYMGELAAAGKFSEIDQFIANVHASLKSLKYSGFPVVAAPYGLALGGGCEVCLWSDKIVAHCELYMGLVEIGAGLLPAGGGCTNLWRRLIEAPLTPVTDMLAVFLKAFEQIAFAKVGMSAMEAKAAGFIRPQDRIVFNKDYLIGEAKKEVLKMVDDGYVAPFPTPIKVMGYYAMGGVDAQLPAMRAAGFITPHMGHIARTIAYVLSGGDTPQNGMISEDYMLRLEREAFVELWKTESTRKMAEHMLTKGKPLMI